MSDKFIKELTKKTKANEITWSNLVGFDGYKLGYWICRDENSISVCKGDGIILTDYRVNRIDDDGVTAESLVCSRREGRKLYRAIEQSRTDMLVGTL